MTSQRIKFPNSEGELLGARLDFPDSGEPVAFALFAHCFTCTKNLRAINHISRSLTDEGIAVLRFDFTGLGESEGDFADSNFSSNVLDLVYAANYMAATYQAPQLLIGHSLGGAAVLHAAATIPSVRAVVTIGAPSDPGHVEHLLLESIDEIEEKGQACVLLAGREFTIKKQFLDDLDKNRMSEAIENIKAALLVMHAPLDNTVGIDNAGEIFGQARHPKSFVTLDKADHLLTNPEDASYVGQVIAAWATKYVDVAPQAAPSALEDWYDDRVAVRTASGFFTEARAQGFNLIVDEPVSSGGTDKGPDPYGYLLTSLGACTSITVRMYANRKGWPLESIVVRLEHKKVKAQDCEECVTESGRVDIIERDVVFNGPLDEEQLARLVDIADKCPVHRTMTSETVIRTNLVEK